MRQVTAHVLAQIFQEFPVLKQHVGLASGNQEDAKKMIGQASRQLNAVELQRPNPWMRIVRKAAA